MTGDRLEESFRHTRPALATHALEVNPDGPCRHLTGKAGPKLDESPGDDEQRIRRWISDACRDESAHFSSRMVTVLTNCGWELALAYVRHDIPISVIDQREAELDDEDGLLNWINQALAILNRKA